MTSESAQTEPPSLESRYGHVLPNHMIKPIDREFLFKYISLFFPAVAPSTIHLTICRTSHRILAANPKLPDQIKEACYATLITVDPSPPQDPSSQPRMSVLMCGPKFLGQTIEDANQPLSGKTSLGNSITTGFGVGKDLRRATGDVKADAVKGLLDVMEEEMHRRVSIAITESEKESDIAVRMARPLTGREAGKIVGSGVVFCGF